MMTTDEKLTTFAINLRRLRVAKRYSIRELAELAGVSTIGLIERGERRDPHLSSAIEIAKALDVDLGVLFVPVPDADPSDDGDR